MTDPLAVAVAIAGVPGVEPATARYRSLGARFTHTTWLVETPERRLVLRLDTPNVRTLGLDRRLEAAVLRRAGEAGLAPPLVHADPDAGLLVYEYLPGRSWTPGDLDHTANLEALAALLRQVHALPRAGITLDTAAAAERYLAVLEPHPELREPARRCRDVVASVAPPADPVCCHNDVVAANVLATPALKLIDWEYAADNDPYFDLANLVACQDLDDRRADALLAAYAASTGGEARERFEDQRRVADHLQWLWLAVRQTIVPDRATAERLRKLADRLR